MPKTILMVDDGESVTKIFSLILKSKGYSCLTAANGNEAIEQAGNADAILMDCDMPVKSGLEALVEIRKTYAEKPIFMMSGEMDKERENWLVENGANECLRKPFNYIDLVNLLKKYIG